MENKLSTIPHSVDDIVRLGKVFYESKMFTDVASMAQAIVKVQAGSELGIPPFVSMSGIHIIKGKPVIGAGLMAAILDKHPEYDYKVLKQDAESCEIEFFKNGKSRGISIFTASDAVKAGTQNMGKFPQNMLFARAMSNGVKWYAPGIFAGPVYVPEEFAEDIEHEEVKESAKKDAKKEEDLNPHEKAHTDYLEFLDSSKHVFNDEERKKYMPKDNWILKDYDVALKHLNKVRIERENMLHLELQK